MGAAYFTSASEFRGWLEARHAIETELLVGIHGKASGKGGLTYAEALDEALCFGWIDGVRRRLDADSYSIRFTPRRPRSIWSLVNVRHATRLIATARMRPAGRTAFNARDKRRTGIYSFERRPQSLPPPLKKVFQANGKAWAFWIAQPPGYRRTATWWVISAVKEETRLRRLDKVIGVSSCGRRLMA